MTNRNRWALTYFLFVGVLALYLLHTPAPFVSISPLAHRPALLSLRPGEPGVEVLRVFGSGEPINLRTGGQVYLWEYERIPLGYRIWWAHPLVWLGMLLLLCRCGRAAALCGALALWLALDILPLKLALNNPWHDLHIGYYVWLLDMLLLIGGGLLLHGVDRDALVLAEGKARRRKEEPQNPTRFFSEREHDHPQEGA